MTRIPYIVGLAIQTFAAWRAVKFYRVNPGG
jgi:hypothetical protein